ncbi:hypothetical protein JAO73_06180 [Hymenobacter sp. BT523]|uniref:hypothetical protein n=1 Tax=Hymenobacter sp. BT523 TaxID=2795725 RepID=UPI0018EC8873|nr:hypothetical protein [Hymenobacter sp. BT523]MBJ6108585.1 hypothetical protein [Hymenobacter sp. BT523]
MLKNYPLLFVLAGLLAAGCGRERKNQEAAAGAQPPVAADTASHARVPPTAAPDSRAAGAAARAQPAGATAPEPSPPVRIKRGATVLADAPNEAPAEEELATTPDSAATGELRRFLLTGLPAAQPFAIRPGRDTMVTGAQGTQLLLPAGIWALPAADSNAVVTLELREFYSPADMVLAGLSTTAGPQLLETGGMLHLTATANGQPVQLRPGAFVHLRMPAKEKKPGMQLFAGVEKGPGRIDWQVPAPQPPAAPAPAAVATRKPAKELPARRGFRARKPNKKKKHIRGSNGWMETEEPEFATGEKGFRKALAASIEYPDATRARLRRGRRMSKTEHTALRRASEEYKERILRIVGVDMALDSTGTPHVTIPASTDAELAKAISGAFQQLPPWEPALFSTAGVSDSLTPGEASRTVAIYFGESGRVLVAPKDWNLAKTAHRRNNAFYSNRIKQIRARYIAARGYTDSMYAARPRYYDSLQRVGALAELVRLRTQFTDTSKAAITQEGVYNELSAQGLRWINCDRYLGPGPLVSFGVNTGRTGAVATLLFRGYQSIMGGEQLTSAKTVFKNVPLGKIVTVLALRRENGITYLSTRRSVVGLSALSGFSFRPVTMAELRAEIARLN